MGAYLLRRLALVVPTDNADEAALVPGIRVVAVPSLREAAIWHGAGLEPEPVEAITRSRTEPTVPAALDLADVIGNVDAVEALVVAAAGGHHLLADTVGRNCCDLISPLVGHVRVLLVESELPVTSMGRHRHP